LPVFPIYFENDDAADRSTGRDSRLYFTAPADGTYLAKVRDVRGTEGADFKYKLTVRPRQPRFKASLRGGSPKVAPGSAKRFSVFVERFEGFDGPVRVDLSGLPPGFSATTPLTVEAGQLDAEGVVYADDDAKAPSDEQASASMATATAEIGGQEVVQKINNLGKIQLDKASAVRLRITAVDDGAKPIVDEPGQPLEFEMQPGETILLGLRAERSGHDGEISCGKVGAGHNLPFGTIVDNLGLNGLLIPHGKNRQIMFIKADPVTAPQTRAFFVETGVAGGQASLPVILHIRPAAK
jgi:hypothetical protein